MWARSVVRARRGDRWSATERKTGNEPADVPIDPLLLRTESPDWCRRMSVEDSAVARARRLALRRARRREVMTPQARWRGLPVSPWIAVDAVLLLAGFLLAQCLRLDFQGEAIADSLVSRRFYILVGVAVLTIWAFGWVTGLYRGHFYRGSPNENVTVLASYALATMVSFIVNLVLGAPSEVPRSVPVSAGTVALVVGIALRWYVRREQIFGASYGTNAEKVLVFGAGDGGRQLISQLRRSPVSPFNPVAMLDDDPQKQSMVLNGVRVRGTREDIAKLASKYEVSTLLVAVPSLRSEDLIDIRDRAEAAGLYVLVLPALDELMKGRKAVDELREINVNDLLGRKPARLNLTQIAESLRGKRILVTGAGGSIGSELCRQLSRFRPAELMMLDRDESGLHSVQLSITDSAMLDGDDTILASIRDRESIMEIFQERRPQIVFHAAALKHMPLLEQYPLEALKTNALGTQNVLDAAEAAGVEVFVNVSTDKAANPSSVLGYSKRVAERFTAAKATEHSDSKYVSVRFGNVLGSRGSVLTVFEKQIKSGGPVTVTDPEVNRFFMTIPEACQLVLQAAAVGESGETLVLDMGEPIKIADVARTLIEQSGSRIEIVYTGLRANEKMAEELFDDSEEMVQTERHEALSEVRVPPLVVDKAKLESIRRHEDARAWMESHTYVNETALMQERNDGGPQ